MGGIRGRRDGCTLNSHPHSHRKSGHRFRPNSGTNIRLSTYAQSRAQSDHQDLLARCDLRPSTPWDASIPTHTLRMGLQGLGRTRSYFMLRDSDRRLRASCLHPTDSALDVYRTLLIFGVGPPVTLQSLRSSVRPSFPHSPPSKASTNLINLPRLWNEFYE